MCKREFIGRGCHFFVVGRGVVFFSLGRGTNIFCREGVGRDKFRNEEDKKAKKGQNVVFLVLLFT